MCPKSIPRKEVNTYDLHTRISQNGKCHLAQVGLVYGEADDQITGDALRSGGHKDGRNKTMGHEGRILNMVEDMRVAS